MAGGEGIRLRPLTYVIPKPLLSLGRHTVIEHLIKSLSENNFNEIYILSSYQCEKFKICLDYQEKFNVKINLHKEEKMLGTVGGIIKIKEKLNEHFLLINSDIILEMDFQEMFRFHLENDAILTIGTKQYNPKLPYGTIKRDDGDNFTGYIEKPSYTHEISIGVNIVSPQIFDFLRGNKVDFPEIANLLYKAGKKIAVHRVNGLWLDIGQAYDYEKAIEILRQVEDEQI